jgi:hypothetical protein
VIREDVLPQVSRLFNLLHLCGHLV